MSAGNFFGTLFVSIMVSAVWIVLGAAIDKIGQIFNRTIQILPTFQDAVTGFTITQQIWSVLLIVMWLFIWINYAQNEAIEAGGYI